MNALLRIPLAIMYHCVDVPCLLPNAPHNHWSTRAEKINATEWPWLCCMFFFHLCDCIQKFNFTPFHFHHTKINKLKSFLVFNSILQFTWMPWAWHNKLDWGKNKEKEQKLYRCTCDYVYGVVNFSCIPSGINKRIIKMNGKKTSKKFCRTWNYFELSHARVFHSAVRKS